MYKLSLNLAVKRARDDYLLRKERQRQGIERNRKKFIGKQPNLAVHKKIRELREKGATYENIAAILNVSVSSVYRVLKNYKSPTKLNNN